MPHTFLKELKLFKNRLIIMNNDITQSFDQIARQTREHYTDFSLKLLAQSVGYSIRRIKLSPYTKHFGYNSGLDSIDTLIADISMYVSEGGLLSHLEMLPHYHLSDEDIAKAPFLCDDLVVRFSIYPEGNGFFTPTWIRGTGDGFTLQSYGARIDWDKMANQTYRKTGIRSPKWIIPGMTYENATTTHEGNVKAVKEMLSLWFMSGIKH